MEKIPDLAPPGEARREQKACGDVLPESYETADHELIVVTGSSGTIGRELVRLLSAAGAAVRAVSRDIANAQQLPHVDPFRADLRDAQQVEAALVGASSVFLLTGNDPGFAGLQTTVIDAAARAGVAHLVKLSALGASDLDLCRDYRRRDLDWVIFYRPLHWSNASTERGGYSFPAIKICCGASI